MCRKLYHLTGSLVLVLAMAVPICSAAVGPITSITTDNPDGSPPYNILSITVGSYTVAADQLATGTTYQANIGGALHPFMDDFDINTALNYGGTSFVTVNFGGGLWSNSNGDDPDFIVFESGGEAGDTPTFRAVFPDESLGQGVQFPSDWGATGYIRDAAVANDGKDMNGQQLHGMAFSITDLLDVSGNPLSANSVILGLQYERGGMDPVGLFAVVPPIQAHEPSPADGATGVPLDQVLSWKAGVDSTDPDLPNPNIKEHYLWLSKPYDPANPPIGPDWNDPAVKQFTIGADTNPADGSVDPSASKPVTGLLKDALYYWVVDEGLTGSSGPGETDPAKIIWSSIWSFETVTSGPDADAGSSIVTWLEAGTTTVDLNGTVEDVTGDVTTIAWSVLARPDQAVVNIANSSVAATTATLNETGRYVLELYAKDAAQNEDSDMMEINVYADSCEAAKNNPDGYAAPAYDFNDDCEVNFIDFAMFAATWLEDESLTEDALYEPDTIFLPPVVQFTNPLDGSTVSGEVIINAIAYDEAVGTTDGDGMLGAGYVFFEVLDSAGTVLDDQMENQATFDMTWNTASGLYPNGVYTIRVTAESDAGEQAIKEISVTVSN